MNLPDTSAQTVFDGTYSRFHQQIDRIKDKVGELRNLTLFLIESDDAPPEQIDAWLVAEGFDGGDDRLFLPRPAWERMKRGDAGGPPGLSYFWPEPLRHDPQLRSHFHALRHLAGPMSKQIAQLQGLPQYLYFQHARNGVITYPFINPEGIIPPDFDWKTYYPWRCAGPQSNPERAFRWITPAEDLGSQGPFIIGALPLYHGDDCIGIWCMDVPLAQMQPFLFPHPRPPGQQFFVIDEGGRILMHPDCNPIIRPHDRILIWKPLAILGGEFVHLDGSQIKAEGRGSRPIIDGTGRMQTLFWGTLPDVDWILLSVAAIPDPPAIEIHQPAAQLPDPQLFRETLELCVAQGQLIKGWQQSYQTLIARFSAIFFSLTPDPKITILYISPQVEGLLEFPARAFFDNPDLWCEIIVSEDRIEHERRFAEFMAGQEPFHHMYRMRTRSGTVKWVREEAVMIRDQSGKCLLIQGLLFDITPQKNIEENLRIREFEIRSLSDRLLDLQEVERRNISTVLHDHMGQLLTLTRLEIESLKIESNSQPGRDRCLTLVDDALKSIRSLASALCPPFLDDLELTHIMSLVAENFRYGAHLSIDLTCDSALPPAPSNIKTLLYRVVGEALTNVVRHANARSVCLRLKSTVQPPGLLLTIQDDGQGFDTTRGSRSGTGLIGMRERILQLGGDFSITSTPGRGSQLVLFVPLTPPLEGKS